MKIIDLINAIYEKRILEGFRFVFDNNVYEVKSNNEKLKIVNKHNVYIGYNYNLEMCLEDEIEILTPDLLKNDDLEKIHDDFLSPISYSFLNFQKKNSITQNDIEKILQNSIIKFEKLGDKTTLATAILQNGFVIVKSSSCVDPKNFDMKIGQDECMKRIIDKIWELEGYKLQSELKGDD